MDVSNYIKKARESGLSDSEIRQKLLSVGWKSEQIEPILQGIPGAPMPPVLQSQPPSSEDRTHQIGSNMWDTFEHVLLFISLYVMAFCGAMLLHTFVDKYQPAVSSSSNYGYDYYGSFQTTLIRAYLSGLIVSAPIFSILFLRITKQTMLRPTLRRLPTRKSLIYMTLVITFIFFIIELIHAVYSLLEGNVTMNFILHFLVTVGISGIIFVYYYHQVKHDRQAFEHQ